jgi:hypothetical protein
MSIGLSKIKRILKTGFSSAQYYLHFWKEIFNTPIRKDLPHNPGFSV